MRKMMTPKTLAVFGGALVLAALAYWFIAPKAMHRAANEVRLPELSQTAKLGKRDFDNNCASCHGTNATGSSNGPPLVHKIYNPGHHSDVAFFRAVALGSRQHHWGFGDMPPLPHVSERQVARIVAYVRELQAANGIGYEKHSM